MLSKLFTQSHQAEKVKLRLVSGCNQNKRYCSFKWTVKPLGVCSLWGVEGSHSPAGSLGLDGGEPEARLALQRCVRLLLGQDFSQAPGPASCHRPCQSCKSGEGGLAPAWQEQT